MVITLLLISLIVPLSFVGCIGQTTTVTTPTRSYSVVKATDVTDLEGTKWQIYQLSMVLQGGGTFTIDMNLMPNAKVSCWYNTEQPTSGGSVSFHIEAGDSIIYPLGTPSSADPGDTSDNLTFTASQADGSSYRLIFHNNLPDINANETIYTEISCPANPSGEDSIFVPLETN
jgi:hypothetical protein